MTLSRFFLVGLLAGAAPLSAQTVVRPDPVLDSAHAAVRDALGDFRDSLQTIEAAGARLQRGTHGASAAWIRARARQMAAACAASQRILPTTRDGIRAGVWQTARERAAQADLLKAFEVLGAKLRWCQERFAPPSDAAGIEAIRNSGNYWRGQLSAALTDYDRAAGYFLSTLGIKVRPKVEGRVKLSS